ncbi:MAG: hypothetical protein IKS42_10670 [Oscillospiraceae bacterium]|nr:hypothetical protein [Oscillospiraceae bacterium]
MKDKTFRRLLLLVTALGLLSVIALTAYTWYLHGECSVLSYIANGG